MDRSTHLTSNGRNCCLAGTYKMIYLTGCSRSIHQTWYFSNRLIWKWGAKHLLLKHHVWWILLKHAVSWVILKVPARQQFLSADIWHMPRFQLCTRWAEWHTNRCSNKMDMIWSIWWHLSQKRNGHSARQAFSYRTFEICMGLCHHAPTQHDLSEILPKLVIKYKKTYIFHILKYPNY